METTNKLPGEYWVENPWPAKLEKEQFREVWKEMEKGGNISGDNRWYRVKDNRYSNHYNGPTPSDSKPVVDFQTWKAAILGTQEEVKKEFAVGDWAVIIKNSTMGHNRQMNKAYQVHELSSTPGRWIRLKNDGLQDSNGAIGPECCRFATREEIDIAQGKVTTEKSQEAVGFKAGDWVTCKQGFTDSTLIGEYGGAGYKSGRTFKVNCITARDVLWPETDGEKEGKGMLVKACRPATQEEINKAQGITPSLEIPPAGKGKLSFRTEDGYDLYNGDMPAWVYKKPEGWRITTNVGKQAVCESHGPAGDTRKLFKHQEAAEKWVKEQNQPAPAVVKSFLEKEEERNKQMSMDSKEFQIGEEVELFQMKGASSSYYSSPIGTKAIVISFTPAYSPKDSSKISVQVGVKTRSSDWYKCDIRKVQKSSMVDKSLDSRGMEWQIGDKLPIGWSNYQTTHSAANDGIPKRWNWPDSNREIHEVRTDGWARIGNCMQGWLPPKSQCTLMPLEKQQQVPVTDSRCIGWQAGDQFKGSNDEGIIYTLSKITGNQVLITWNSTSDSYSIERVNKYIASGSWIVIKNSNNQSSIINKNQQQNEYTECSSGSTGSERSEQIIVSGNPEEPAFQRGNRKPGSPGQSGGELLTVVRGRKGHGSVLESSEESSY